jgi:uncharacterized protein YjbJ (UPF0337 family)
MTDDRIAGAAKNFGGKVEEGFGRVTGDYGMQAKGRARQVEGDVQDLYGQVKDTASDAAVKLRDTAYDAAETVRDTAYEAGDYVREFVEQRPYTTAFAALCIGWFIGRMGRTD